MDFEWLFREKIFRETITPGEEIDDNYYGVGELLCDVFLVTQLKILHYQFQNPTYENQKYRDMIRRLYTSNKYCINLIHKVKADLVEISRRYHELDNLKVQSDYRLETLLVSYLDRIAGLQWKDPGIEMGADIVQELYAYLRQQPQYGRLLSHIEEIEQTLLGYQKESHPHEVMKLGKRLVLLINKIPDKAGKHYKTRKDFYTYLHKFERFLNHPLNMSTAHLISEGNNPAELSELVDALTDNIKNFTEDMQHVVCSAAIYNESTHRDLLKTMKEYINDKSNQLKDYGEDGGRCFALMEVYGSTGYHEIFTLSGVWDSNNVDIEKFFRKYGRNQNLIDACIQLQSVLGNIEWAITNDLVKNYMLDCHLEMQCVGTLGDKRSGYDSGFIDHDRELEQVRRDFACCERKMLAYMETRPKDYSLNKQCNLFVKYQPCEKCQYALSEFRNRMFKKKEDFFLEYVRIGELEE